MAANARLFCVASSDPRWCDAKTEWPDLRGRPEVTAKFFATAQFPATKSGHGFSELMYFAQNSV